MKKTRVMLGFVGTKLDEGFSARRWRRWRPNVSLHKMPSSQIDRVELLHATANLALAQRVCADIQEVSCDIEIRLHTVDVDDFWDFSEVYAALYDWAKTYPFDTEKEEYWIHITTGTHVAQICLFLLVEARVMPGVLLQTSPPKGTPPSVSEPDYCRFSLIDLDLARYDNLAARLVQAQSDGIRFLKSGIPTRNPAFNRMIGEIERIAVQSSAPILLMGATGSGKSMLARRIFELKKARHLITGRFVDVNCATLRGDTASSTLFGHSKGSFTGAVVARAGFLKTADKGVLFLDEIAELGLDEQAMLLKAIEEKHFFPVGSDHEERSQFQLIAGTHRDLRQEVAKGCFREDLFARINIWQYQLPSLCERREDIEPNIEHQLLLVGEELGRFVRFNQEAKKHYLDFAHSHAAKWHGNFRDLASSITRLATLAEKGRIGVELVAAEIQRLQILWDYHHTEATPFKKQLLEQLFKPEILAQWDVFEQLQLEAVLQVCHMSASLPEAGRVLFNQSRLERSSVNDSDRLRKYLKKYGLDWRIIRAQAT